jgi:hypothetical protein
VLKLPAPAAEDASGLIATNSASPIEGVRQALAIQIDSDGSPVSVPAANWLVCFVPGLKKQWYHRFTHEKHQHVFAIRMVDACHWLLVEPWWTKMLVSVLTLDQAQEFLRWGTAGDVLQVREVVPGRGSQVRGWSNCAVSIAFLLGRSYRTWTPHGLYRRLVAESGTQAVDVVDVILNGAPAAGLSRVTPVARHNQTDTPKSDDQVHLQGCLGQGAHA